ncbi:MAG: anti-sigma factor [Nitrospira sp.]|nr:anti-sigma factor [Nitrospira sp.]
MTHQELEDAIPLYVLGALERGERQALDAHLLSGCASCHTALRAFQAVATALPFSLDLVSPPRLLRATIISEPPPQITRETQQNLPHREPGKWLEHVFRLPPTSPSVGVTVGAGLVIITAMAASLYLAQPPRQLNKTENPNASPSRNTQETASHLVELEREHDDRERLLNQMREELHLRLVEIADLKDQLIQREAELDVLKTQLDQHDKRRAHMPEDELAVLLRIPTIKVAVLAGTEAAEDASGIFLYDHRTRKAWLYTRNLPACPAGTEYRLWLLNEQPVSIGAFRIGPGETSHLFVQSIPGFPGAKAFSVSLEPVGGGRKPAGAPYLRSYL